MTDFDPSLSELFEARRSEMDMPSIELRGRIYDTTAGIEVAWLPRDEYEERVIRHTGLYPAIGDFAKVHDHSLEFTEARQTENLQVVSFNLDKVTLRTILGSVVKVIPVDVGERIGEQLELAKGNLAQKRRNFGRGKTIG